MLRTRSGSLDPGKIIVVDSQTRCDAMNIKVDGTLTASLIRTEVVNFSLLILGDILIT